VRREAHAEPLLHLVHPMDIVIPNHGEEEHTGDEHRSEEPRIGEMEGEVQGKDTQEKVPELIQDG